MLKNEDIMEAITSKYEVSITLSIRHNDAIKGTTDDKQNLKGPYLRRHNN